MAKSILKNKVQLITYSDCLGKNLKDLHYVLDTYFKDVIGGVHILPFYPSSADRGFAPLTHLEINPSFGDWKDVSAIGEDYDLMVDLVVNHISSASPYFKDFIQKGDDSEWKDIFLDVDKLLKQHRVSIEAIDSTYRPNPAPPICPTQLADGSTRRLWCTFSNDQIDLDVSAAKTRELLSVFLEKLISNNAKLIRLDAVGYTVKRPKSSSFLVAETFEFMHWLKSIMKDRSVELLAEVHHHYKRALSPLHKGAVDWAYDFALPLLTLHTLFTSDSTHLKNWINIRPNELITTLDTHDGIGVIDVKDLLPQSAIDAAVDRIKNLGGNNLYRASGEGSNNVDIYQINTTYYSALGESDDAYITARAIQFFTPGIPQVYYVGLLAGSNDIKLFEKTNHGRDINRHYYTLEEIHEKVQQPVVQRLIHLMKLRSTHPAFNGTFSLEESSVTDLKLHWNNEDVYCNAHIDLANFSVEVEYVDPKTGRVELKNY